MAKISLTGELTIYQAGELKLILQQALEQSRHDLSAIELDLSGITEVDGAGLQLLLSAAKSILGTEMVLRLHNTPETLTKLLDTYHITNRFTLV